MSRPPKEIPGRPVRKSTIRSRGCRGADWVLELATEAVLFALAFAIVVFTVVGAWQMSPIGGC